MLLSLSGADRSQPDPARRHMFIVKPFFFFYLIEQPYALVLLFNDHEKNCRDLEDALQKSDRHFLLTYNIGVNKYQPGSVGSASVLLCCSYESHLLWNPF